MIRTKTRPEPLFEPRRRSGKEIHGGEQLISEIKKTMIPYLEETGYRCRIVTAKKVARRLPFNKRQDYAVINPRLLLDGKGIFIEIWSLEEPQYRIPLKPFLIEKMTPKAVGNRPRMTLNEGILVALKKYPEEIHHKIICNMFYTLDLHFIIMTKAGTFWIDKFHSIPDHQWYLTYIKDKNKLNRIAVKAETQEMRFLTKTQLPATLKKTIISYQLNNKHKVYGNESH